MGDIAKIVCIKCAALLIPSFSLQWNSDESTKHSLTQMLLVINWRYWKAGQNSRMGIMKVQGRLMQARFIEILQVFAKIKLGYFSNRALKYNEPLSS